MNITLPAAAAIATVGPPLAPGGCASASAVLPAATATAID